MLSKTFFLAFSAIFFAYFYIKWNKGSEGENEAVDAEDWEQIVFDSWATQIRPPKKNFSRVVLGVNSNVDLIVRGTSLLTELDQTPSAVVVTDRDILHTLEDLEAAFALAFSRGVGAERAFSNVEAYTRVTYTASQLQDAQWYIGGNAALMAQEVVEEFPGTEVWLVGPVGPRLKPLLGPEVQIPAECLQESDEVHLIMEYEVGERWGNHTAPVATRFITSYDEANSKMSYLTTWLSHVTGSTSHVDLAVLSGLHFIDTQPREVADKILQELREGLPRLKAMSTPVHLELASMANEDFVSSVVTQILPLVSSIGLNEQELAFLSTVAGGPFHGKLPADPPLNTVTSILTWILHTYGPKSTTGSSLTRIHFHSLTYHVIATTHDVTTQWTNSLSAAMAGARAASLQACDTTFFNEGHFELQIPKVLQLGEDTSIPFDPRNPGTSWGEGEVQFYHSPVLVCKKPLKTVGLGDAISATGLMYSHYTEVRK